MAGANGARTAVRNGPHRWLPVFLGVWVLAPIALLAVRALAQSWRYPDVLPTLTDASSVWPSGGSGRLVSALSTSLLLGVLTGPVGTVLGFAVARSVARADRTLQRLTIGLALLAVVAPPIALGVGLRVAVLGLGLGGTLTGVFLAHLIPAAGYLTLLAAGVFTRFDFSLEDEARSLGASPWQVLVRITMPLIRPQLGEGMILGGLVSWGQLAMTLLVGGGVVRTLPVELLSFVQSGNDQLGALAALVLSVPPMFAIGLLTLGARRTGAMV